MRMISVPAPAPGQDTNGTNPLTALVVNNSVANAITFSPNGPSGVDARAGHALVRYTSDPRPGPGAGLWRTAGDGMRELISPFALVQRTPGQFAYEIWVVLPRTGERRIFTGDLDEIASALHRAGQRLGCRSDRKMVYWALREFCDQARRQAARGEC